MSNPNIAEWINKERDEVARLAGKLRESATFAPRACTEAWLASVRDRFEHLRAHLQKHVAFEEASGYIAAAALRRPWLSNGANQLADKDRDLCDRVHDLLAYIERHEQEENDLVEFALTDDVGIKD